MIRRFFRTPALSQSAVRRVLTDAESRLGKPLGQLSTEFCFYVELSGPLTLREESILRWLLAETFEPDQFGMASFVEGSKTVIEVGPRLNFETPYSSNAVAICHKCGLTKVRRLERSIRYGLGAKLSVSEAEAFVGPLHDRMTEERYSEPRTSFTPKVAIESVRVIPLIEEGISALKQLNAELGLGMDEQDELMWFNYFVHTLKRNPTDVELFQIGQANSEHSRHGWFKGKHVIDGHVLERTPFDIVRATWNANPTGSVIAFADNSSAIHGQESLQLAVGWQGSDRVYRKDLVLTHPDLTAETHNHPSGIEPYQGAQTGTGGRIRDNQMIGCGGIPIVGGAGYFTANLCIPGYELPWERGSRKHPANMASPLDIMIRASDGASDYGNCFGEPVIYGTVRAFEMQLPDEYRGWFKPIMYSVGAGLVRDEHTKKAKPEKGMLVILLGGPGFRIGVGGGAASSLDAGANTAALDFASVQRGNAEMENRVDRVIRACINMGLRNLIRIAHDLGAGGTCNALPEAVDPAGARFYLREIPVADPTLSTREIWGNEAQERNVIVIDADRLEELQAICDRESCPMSVVGEITGDGNLVLYDSRDDSTPVNLPLEGILGKLPQKTFHHTRIQPKLTPLVLPKDLTVREALDRVLRLVSVASKHWLTNKVDRSVTGLVVQQQCVGPNHRPLSDYAIRADSYFGLSGAVMSLGEQPIKGLISPAAMARLAVAEALLNMSGAVINDPQQIKCSGNWMWAAKKPGEGPRLLEAAEAAERLMIMLGMAIDGGKDSLSMAVKLIGEAGVEEIIKAPGQFIVATYAATSDFTKRVTPDLKRPGNHLYWLDLGLGQARLGGSALAQTFNQIGMECPDVNDTQALKKTFEGVQQLILEGVVESVHDVSDGGLITAVLEMAFAGNTGLKLDLAGNRPVLSTLFAEEPGLVLELTPGSSIMALGLLKGELELPIVKIGEVGEYGGKVVVQHNHNRVLDDSMVELRSVWEETGNRLERLQADPDCTIQQEQSLRVVTEPPYGMTFTPVYPNDNPAIKPRVALLREEGTNGDREMAATLMLVGFEVQDVTTNDLIAGNVSLDEFVGLVFPGGFSFGDVLDSAKGWAGVIRFNEELARQFERFRNRKNTFSLGVCNGAQLSPLLGCVPGFDVSENLQPRFIRNKSGRFESRFTTVRIEESPAIMFKGMAGSILGIWLAHGEGQFRADRDILDWMLDEKLAPVRYVDNEGSPTEVYPFNPNGSPQGIAAICSQDGRHVAIMPHLERTSLPWQWPWVPQEWRKDFNASPWLKAFQNLYEWCVSNLVH